MTILTNEITILAPIENVWAALANIDTLDQYDPTVKKSTSTTRETSGVGAKRKVDMLDGKNWFEEEVTVCKPNEALAFELTSCSFPIEQLTHRYSFETDGNSTKVKQIMQYRVKFGLFGKLLDAVIIRKQSDSGIKKFMSGLKSFAEKSSHNNYVV